MEPKIERVIKRDGTQEKFQFRKISSAILRASKSCKVTPKEEKLEELKNEFSKLEVEVITIVGEFLDKYDPNVAKKYVANRRDHTKTKDFVKRKIGFINKYKKTDNTANSTIDDNSNVGSRNIGVLNAEIHKEDNIDVSRAMIMSKLEELFPDFDPKQYIEDLESHIIYKNDESSFCGAISPYCVSMTMYPFLTDGIYKIGGLSAKPKNLDSFCGMFINLVFATSAQFAGACMYKDQPLIIKTLEGTFRISSKDLVEKYLQDIPNQFENYQGKWEYSSCNGLQVLEDGKFVDIKKVYRRKYSDKIYKISTKDGHSAIVSKDHIFKHLFKGRHLETKASNLQVGDTVFLNKDYSCFINFESSEFKRGWITGMICGDGSITEENNVRLSVNYEQEYLGDLFNKFSEELYGTTLNKNNGNKCWDYRKYNKDYYKKIHSYIIGSTTYDKHIVVKDILTDGCHATRQLGTLLCAIAHNHDFVEFVAFLFQRYDNIVIISFYLDTLLFISDITYFQFRGECCHINTEVSFSICCHTQVCT